MNAFTASTPKLAKEETVPDLMVKDLMNDLVKEKDINARIKEQLKQPIRQHIPQELSFGMTSMSISSLRL